MIPVIGFENNYLLTTSVSLKAAYSTPRPFPLSTHSSSLFYSAVAEDQHENMVVGLHQWLQHTRMNKRQVVVFVRLNAC